MQFGLAPLQMATDCSEEDCQIFRSLCHKLSKTNHSQIFNNLYTNYPHVASKLLEKEQRYFVKHKVEQVMGTS